MTDAAKRHPMDQLEIRRDVCNVYYKRYSVKRGSIGRPMSGRLKSLDKRVAEEIRTDNISHYIEAINFPRRCAVCGKKVRKQCRKCNVGLHIECFVDFHRL
jgi:hypothetical protein